LSYAPPLCAPPISEYVESPHHAIMQSHAFFFIRSHLWLRNPTLCSLHIACMNQIVHHLLRVVAERAHVLQTPAKISLLSLQILAQVLEMAVSSLGAENVSNDTARTIVEATISTLQALISLIDESTPKANMSLEPSRELQRLAVDCKCVRWIGRVGCECIPAVVRVHVRSDADALISPPSLRLYLLCLNLSFL
jgi:hypothetical protein